MTTRPSTSTSRWSTSSAGASASSSSLWSPTAIVSSSSSSRQGGDVCPDKASRHRVFRRSLVTAHHQRKEGTRPRREDHKGVSGIKSVKQQLQVSYVTDSRGKEKSINLDPQQDWAFPSWTVYVNTSSRGLTKEAFRSKFEIWNIQSPRPKVLEKCLLRRRFVPALDWVKAAA